MPQGLRKKTIEKPEVFAGRFILCPKDGKVTDAFVARARHRQVNRVADEWESVGVSLFPSINRFS